MPQTRAPEGTAAVGRDGKRIGGRFQSSKIADEVPFTDTGLVDTRIQTKRDQGTWSKFSARVRARRVTFYNRSEADGTQTVDYTTEGDKIAWALQSDKNTRYWSPESREWYKDKLGCSVWAGGIVSELLQNGWIPSEEKKVGREPSVEATQSCMTACYARKIQPIKKQNRLAASLARSRGSVFLSMREANPKSTYQRFLGGCAEKPHHRGLPSLDEKNLTELASSWNRDTHTTNAAVFNGENGDLAFELLIAPTGSAQRSALDRLIMDPDSVKSMLDSGDATAWGKTIDLVATGCIENDKIAARVIDGFLNAEQRDPRHGSVRGFANELVSQIVDTSDPAYTGPRARRLLQIWSATSKNYENTLAVHRGDETLLYLSVAQAAKLNGWDNDAYTKDMVEAVDRVRFGAAKIG